MDEVGAKMVKLNEGNANALLEIMNMLDKLNREGETVIGVVMIKVRGMDKISIQTSCSFGGDELVKAIGDTVAFTMQHFGLIKGEANEQAN